MLGLSPSSFLKNVRKLFPKAGLKAATDIEQQAQQRHGSRNGVWTLVIVAVIVGGRFLLFKVESNPVQLPMNARDWTGFGESYDNNVSEVVEKGTETDGKTTKNIGKTTTTQKKLQPAKTLWDWMGLLLAPATLAGLGFLFQSSQERAKRDKDEADKKRAADQQREQALQIYFDQLSELLVDKRLLKLRSKEKESTHSEAEASQDKPASKIDIEDTKIDADAALNVVKAKTLTLFRLFDNAVPTDIPRKSSILAFLGDAGLLDALDLDLTSSRWENANLSGAKLRGADLRYIDLRGANLRGADLSSAKLRGAKLSNADLSGARLIGAKLSGADLSGADLSGADLISTKLIGAKLIGAKLGGAILSNTDLSGARLNGARLAYAILSNAKLSGADLSGADLRGADLRGADLIAADLIAADLSGADLRGANLSSAILIGAILSNADLRAEGLFQGQLEGKRQPFLCKGKLPEKIKINPDRDCKKLPGVLQERYRDSLRIKQKRRNW